MATCIPWIAGILLALLASAAALGDDAALQRQLAAERQAVDARFERDKADCQQRFALNACVDEARTRQRQALAALRMQQREVDERQRIQRTSERRAAIERRQAATASRPVAASAASAAAARTPRVAAERAQLNRDRAAERATAQAKAAERAAAARKLQATIQADQARIQERQSRRAAQGKAVAPLPPPSTPR
jgi:colicin import membrane protein